MHSNVMYATYVAMFNMLDYYLWTTITMYYSVSNVAYVTMLHYFIWRIIFRIAYGNAYSFPSIEVLWCSEKIENSVTMLMNILLLC